MVGQRPRRAGLARVHKAAGFTQESLAHAIGVDRATVVRWEAGERTPLPQKRLGLANLLNVTMARLDELLNVPTTTERGMPVELVAADIVGSVMALGGADVDRRAFFGLSASAVVAAAFDRGDPEAITRRVGRVGGVRVGAGEVTAIRAMTKALGDTAAELGGAHARQLTVRYLVDEVRPWLDGTYSETTGRELFVATAELVHLAGWMARDAGEHGVAQRYYLHSHGLAADAGNHELAATALRGLADQALDLGHTATALSLADAADRTGGHVAEPKARAYYATTHARAAAADNDAATARSRLSVAHTAIGHAVGEPGATWASHYSPSRWAHETASVHARLGDFTAAEEHLDLALTLGIDRRRTQAMVLADLGLLRLRKGDTDGALHSWTQFAHYAEGVHSTRVDTSARDITIRLRTIPGNTAATLRDALHTRVHR